MTDDRMTREQYRAEYLKSPWWRQKRSEALKRAGGRCQTCNANRNLDVHHRTYERIGCERQDDLIVLCRHCHDAIHGATAVGNENGAIDDRAKAVVEAKRQTVLITLYLCGGMHRDALRTDLGWPVGIALEGLEARGLVMRERSSGRGYYYATDAGEQWARTLLVDPEPRYWRLPEDPKKPPSKADGRAYHRGLRR